MEYFMDSDNSSFEKQSNLLDLTPKEWAKAKSYFATHSRVKLRRKNQSEHSFIKVGNDIFALANRRNARGYLGEGAFGKVKMVQSETGENFAVKIEGRDARGVADTETQVMKLIDYLKGEAVRYLSSERTFKGEKTDKKLYTVTKLRSGDELFKKLYYDKDAQNRKKLNHSQKLLMALRSCEAIKVLHDKKIIHADIKPENFMASTTEEQVLVESIDYGFSMILDPQATHCKVKTRMGSPQYRAPEIAFKDTLGLCSYSYASDIYALGIMFKEDLLLTNEFENIQIIALVKKMLMANPLHRPDINIIIRMLAQTYDTQIQMKNAVNNSNMEAVRDLSLDLGINTALILAVEHHSTPDFINEILDEMTDVDKALRWAAQNGHTQVVRLLLEKPARFIIDSTNRYGETALMLAAEKGHLEIVDCLLKGHAVINIQCQNGGSALIRAAKNGNSACVKALVNKGADITITDNSNTALMLAAELGHTDVVKILSKNIQLVNYCNKEGNTALMWAAKNGHIECVRILLAAGADVKMTNKKGGTALTYAQESKIRDLLKNPSSCSHRVIYRARRQEGSLAKMSTGAFVTADLAEKEGSETVTKKARVN
jgi:ankyrin repeat protein